ncbi:hypothetical protein LDL59_03475 [Kaistella anthropi]|nr:hypothetical protein [Kaistella anthropi]
MKKLNTFLALFFVLSLSAQTFKYGITGNFHQGSIAGVHDVSKGAFGGGLGVFGEIALVENDVFDSPYFILCPKLNTAPRAKMLRRKKKNSGFRNFTMIIWRCRSI